jgi:hypothetical protein
MGPSRTRIVGQRHHPNSGSRWYAPLKTVHPVNALMNDQTIKFTRKMVDDDEDEERSISSLMDPLELYEDLQKWRPPHRSTPVHFSDLRM